MGNEIGRKISIIIPCFNASKWLPECALSLYSQTMPASDLELIFVNDASTDNGVTWGMLTDLEAAYPEQTMIIDLEENMRQGGARNIGLTYASGEYVLFVDSDDKIATDLCEKVYASAKKHDADIVQFGYHFYVDGYGSIKESTVPKEQVYDIDSEDKRKSFLMGEALTYGCWNKLYRRSLIESTGVKYAEHVIYEEPLFVYPMLFSGRKYVVIPDCLYFYRQNAGGTMHHDMKEWSKFYQHANVQRELYHFMKNTPYFAQFKSEIDWYFIHTYFFETIYFMAKRGMQIPADMFMNLGLTLEKELPEFMSNKYLALPQATMQKKCLELFDELKALWMNSSLMRGASILALQSKIDTLQENVLGEKIEQYRYQFLIMKGSDICHNVLNVFADELGKALIRQGCKVEYFDEMQDGIGGIEKFIGKDYSAVIGMQNYLMYAYLNESKQYLMDLIGGPKINFQFDHPVWMMLYKDKLPNNFFFATHDRNYVEFANKYYDKAGCFLLPPGGIVSDESKTDKSKADEVTSGGIAVTKGDKLYDISFVGTYNDYRLNLKELYAMPAIYRHLANRMISEMRRDVGMTPELALEKAMAKLGVNGDIAQVLFELKPVVFCIMSYYREQVLKTILEAGITLNVFGDSWDRSGIVSIADRCEQKFGKKLLIAHDNVSVEESLDIMSKSKLTLNIMAWHKDGITERVENAMLEQTVVVTDESTALRELLTDEEIAFYRLDELDKLPALIEDLLDNDDKRNSIAKAGKDKAEQIFTWDVRAKELLALL